MLVEIHGFIWNMQNYKRQTSDKMQLITNQVVLYTVFLSLRKYT